MGNERTVSRRKKKKPPSKRSRKKRLTNLDPHAWPVNATQPFFVLRPPFPRQQVPSGLSGQQETITSHVPVGLPRHRPPALQLPYTHNPVRQMAPMWSMHTPMSPPLVRCPVAKIRTKEGALSQSDNLRLKSVCNHEQVRANEGAISQSSLPPLQSVRDDKQEQIRTDKVVVPVSGPLSSDGSMIVIKPLHTLPPFRVDPQRAAFNHCPSATVSKCRNQWQSEPSKTA